MSALLIVDHGSRRAEAHEHLEWIAERVREADPECSVYVAHMELAEPSIQNAIDQCVADGNREICVHPLFLLPGRHSAEDVPRLVEAAASRHAHLEVRITEPLGKVPGLPDLILQAAKR